MIHMNQELFQQALQGEKPVLVEFWAPCASTAAALRPPRPRLQSNLGANL